MRQSPVGPAVKLSRNLALFAVISATVSLVCSQAVLDKNGWVRETITGERDCVKIDWQAGDFLQALGLLIADCLRMDSLGEVLPGQAVHADFPNRRKGGIL
jgi:hypothetical protein